MNDSTYAGMVEATRLTREGRLAEATALIQREPGGMPVPPQASPARASAPRELETTFRVADEPKAVIEAALGASGTIVTPATEAPLVSPIVAAAAESVRRVRAGATSATLNPLLRPGILPGRPGGKRVRRPIPEGAVAPVAGRWLEGTHTDVPGTRAYKLYVPGGYRGQALPLIVMLHGCTQDPDDFAAGTGMNFLAEADEFLVAYPRKPPPPTPRSAGTGSNPPTSSGIRGSPRSSPASRAG